METLAGLLGKLLSLCYRGIGSYLGAIALFTLITKIILFPINILVQKNGIKMVKIMPEINDLKCEYYGDKEKINEETFKLYKREKYNPFVSVIPMVFQLIMLMGVIEVVKTSEYSGIPEARMISFGIDFSRVPFGSGYGYLLFPVTAALSALLMCVAQNKSQVLQAEQGKLNKYGMTAFSVLLSLYLGFFVKAGVAAYWIFSNLFSTVFIYILNAVIDPRKYIDYKKLEASKERLNSLKNHGTKLTAEMKKRQRHDYKRFFSIDNKHLVFYSESSGFYKYYRRLIEWLTTHSNIKIHYITSDPDDAIFKIAESDDRIIPYFIGENKLISLFLKMDAKLVVMTMPDLENYHIKRSYVCKDTEYIYMDHGLSSVNMLLRKGALDHFDTVFCAGKHVVDEIRAIEELYGLNKKNLIEYGYGMLEDLTDSYNEWHTNHSDEDTEKYILLAPSHQKDNILDSCLETVVDGLKKCAPVVIRPHPQYIRRFPRKWEEVAKKYHMDPLVRIESNFFSNETIYRACLVVTDWSNIGYEFSFSTLRPALYVDTPMKVINGDYKKINIEPVDITLRNKIGISVSGKDAETVTKAADKLINGNCIPPEKIKSIREDTVFHNMDSSRYGGQYILSRLAKKK